MKGQRPAKRRDAVNAKRRIRRPRTGGPYGYTVPEAGQMIGLSRSAAYRAASRGDIPTLKINELKIVPKKKWDDILGLESAKA